MIPKTPKESRPRQANPIGVFDSGVGGLSVLRELERLLPSERFIFLADQSYVPYGEKTSQELKDRTERITRFFISKKCKAIVVACNTATCYAIEHLRSTFLIPFIGTVPAIKPAAALSKSGIIGSISTPATAKSPALRKLVQLFAKDVRVIIVGCPGLEELVETGGTESPRAKTLLTKYLTKIVSSGADTLVLGCTHYPFLKHIIRSIAPTLKAIDSGRAVARHTQFILKEHHMASRPRHGATIFFTTGSKKDFAVVSSILMKRNITARQAKI